MSLNRRSFIQGSALASGGALAACATEARTGASDPLFNQPFVDQDEWRDAPIRHRYVHGGFRGTEARFSFYFPPAEQYQGRFFQGISPVPTQEDQIARSGSATDLAFAFESGAYFVASNQGGQGGMAATGRQVDPTIGAYRVSAAAAEYSRVVAAEMYGSIRRIYGYAFGGSGGAFRTISGAENSRAWDGVVPFVMGSPMALPNVYTVRAHAMRVLKDRLPQIVDAIEPGGGDMYANLNEEQSAALLEATRMGFPVRAWPAYQTMGLGAFAILFDSVVSSDPGYFEDFWTVPGYLGANPTRSLLDARVQHETSVVRVVMSDEAARLGLPTPMRGPPTADAASAWRALQGFMGGVFPAAIEVQTAPPPEREIVRASLRIRSGASIGSTLALGSMQDNFAMLGFSRAPTDSIAAIRPGDRVEIDNSNFLAVQTYHRHQVPTRDYYVWDQFRNADGTPKYPQRPTLLGPQMAQGATGVLPTGEFQCKMIVVESLQDFDAFPWQADWYRTKVRQNLGGRFNSNYRLYFTDSATHEGGSGSRFVGYDSMLQQALRDLSAWVERGVPAPESTSYRIDDGQVVVPATAVERRGIQPVVTLSANGSARAEVAVGQSVQLSAVIDMPPNTGPVVGAEWDFEGAGMFSLTEEFTPAPRVTVTRNFVFSRPGTYFPALRAASQRQGRADTSHAKIQNIGRVRVVVS